MASRIQTHIYEILCAFDDACTENDIAYALFGKSGEAALRGKCLKDKEIVTSVAMKRTDFNKFAQISNSTGYKLISNAAGSSTAMLIDENTTAFSYRNPKGFPIPAAGIIINISDPNGSHEKISTMYKKSIKISSSEWGKVVKKPVYDREFPVFSNADKMLDASYSRIRLMRRYQRGTTPVKAVELIYVDDISYKVMMNRDVIKESLKLSHRIRRLYYWVKRSFAAKHERKLKRYENTFRLTSDRFDWWERLYPKKQQLLEMAAADPTGEELCEELAGYVKAIEKHMSNGLGLTFDSEILAITLPVLEQKHNKEWTERYLAAIPKPHRDKDLTDYLIESNVNHPLLQG